MPSRAAPALALALALLPGPARAQEPGARLALRTIDGTTWDTRALCERRAVVLAWTSLGCPMSKLYAPRLAALARRFAARGVQFFLIDSSAQDDLEEIRARAARLDLGIPWVHDAEGVLARRFAATRTTEVVVLDARRRVAYRGAVDDRYGFRRDGDGGVGSYRRPAATAHYLRDALEAVLAGREVPRPRTEPFGCALGARRARRAAGTPAVAFHEDVEPILQRRCQRCHHDGGSAPFPLVEYEDAAGWAETIAEVVAQRVMPPWNADPAVGRFANDPSLSRAEIDAILAWVEAGAPRGDPARAPAPRSWPDGWRIGAPDAVYTTPEVEVAAQGRLPYRYVRLETSLAEDRWIEAAEIRSTAPEVVHHVLVFLEYPEDRPRRADDPWTPPWHWSHLYRHLPPERRRALMWRHRRYYRDMRMAGGGIKGYYLGALPGDPPVVFPEDYGKMLPRGGTLVLQIHYTPNGTPQRSRTSVALRFRDQRPAHALDARAAADVTFEIPPGAADHPVHASFRFPRGATLLALRPHMHLRGKSVRYVLERPDGSEQTLLRVPRYDFDWQHSYVLAEPERIEPGSRLHVHARFDNSATNPDNPDPTVPVYFGLQTDEEMMIGYFEVVWDG